MDADAAGDAGGGCCFMCFIRVHSHSWGCRGGNGWDVEAAAASGLAAAEQALALEQRMAARRRLLAGGAAVAGGAAALGRNGRALSVPPVSKPSLRLPTIQGGLG